jgi:hypothetical protein
MLAKKIWHGSSFWFGFRHSFGRSASQSGVSSRSLVQSRFKLQLMFCPMIHAGYEIFQWLTQHIRDAGGDATLVRAREIEGLPNERLVELFNAARAKEYAALREILRPLVVTTKRKAGFAGQT